MYANILPSNLYVTGYMCANMLPSNQYGVGKCVPICCHQISTELGNVCQYTATKSVCKLEMCVMPCVLGINFMPLASSSGLSFTSIFLLTFHTY